MKLSDYVVASLVERGITDVFLVSGGGIMHLLDSVGANAAMRYHTTSHEQAAVIAAEGYARRTGRLAVALVTVGPGAANAVAGLPGAWVDSVPVLVLAGQVRRDIIADYGVQRQFGPQEANTLDMARPVTKFAAGVRDPNAIRSTLDLALHHARTGRPGPVWIELPLDVQSADVDPARLEPAALPPPERDRADIALEVEAVVELLRIARRPLIVPGNGIHAAGAEAALAALLERSGVPSAVPFSAKDVVAETQPRYAGVFGTAGQRRANFAVQSCDLLIAIGAGLNVQKVGFNYAGFAPKATKVIVDVDESQLRDQAVKPDLAVRADAKVFCEALAAALEGVRPGVWAGWLDAIAGWRERYPVMTPDYRTDAEHVNSYVFADTLSSAVRPSDTIVVGAGLDAVSCYQAFRVAPGQRVLITGWGSMGWDLPLAVGACVGAQRARTIVTVGDGSIQWNLQELITIARFRLPIKIFVFNNGGYASIRATQSAFFEGRFVGADHASGVANPDFAKLAEAYGLGYARARNNDELRAVLTGFLGDDEPGLCELNVAADQAISPKASAFRREDGTFESRPLEDMAPFLPREEVSLNMHLFDDEPVRA